MEDALEGVDSSVIGYITDYTIALVSVYLYFRFKVRTKNRQSLIFYEEKEN